MMWQIIWQLSVSTRVHVTSDRGYTLLKVASDTDRSRTLIMEVPNKIKNKHILISETDSRKVFMDTEAHLVPCAEPHHEITIHVPPTRGRVWLSASLCACRRRACSLRWAISAAVNGWGRHCGRHWRSICNHYAN